MINAILIDIKPDLYDHIFYKFTKELVKKYIHKIRNSQKEDAGVNILDFQNPGLDNTISELKNADFDVENDEDPYLILKSNKKFASLKNDQIFKELRE